MQWWRSFQDGAWWWRVPVKLVITGATVFLILYPYPAMFLRNLERVSNPNALIDPDEVTLAPWIDEVRPELVGVEPGPPALKIVERFVYRKVPYSWDWDTWGVMDYFPTVAEVVRAGREDCDGRAIVSASILRNLGYKADLVGDTMHIWVRTDVGETMSPGREGTFIEATDAGTKYNWGQLRQIPRSLAFGVAVFPVGRELIVLAVLWLLSVRQGLSFWSILGCLLLLVDGLMLIRLAGVNPHDPAYALIVAQILGATSVVAALAVMFAMNRHARERSRSATIRPIAG